MEFRFSYSDEQKRFRAEVREWLEANIPEGIHDDRLTSLERYQRQRELGRRLATRGWLYPLAPKEYGGGGLDADHAMILAEEADRLDVAIPPYYDSGGVIGSVCILVWGTEEQKRTLLPPIHTGEVRTWQVLTEPEAGSDLAGVKMSAIRDGDDYVLNGQKIFIGSTHGADRLWTIARTDLDAPRHQNLSWFMIDARSPGISYQPMYLLHGGERDKDAHKNMIFFDNVRVPASRLVGGENNGWKVASTHLELEHGGAGGLGLARRDKVWDGLLKYCQTHDRGGAPLSKDQDVRDLLAEVYIRSQVQRLFTMRSFWLTHAHRPRSYEGAQFSYYRKMAGLWATNAIVAAVGPAALTDDEEWGDSLLEDWQRRGIVAVHPGGTADIQRVVMARRIGIGRTEREAAGVVHRDD